MYSLVRYVLLNVYARRIIPFVGIALSFLIFVYSWRCFPFFNITNARVCWMFSGVEIMSKKLSVNLPLCLF